ncbi:hypothetical protein ON064_03020 [Planococcus sp. A6]|uniref:hypothetical protein n=1 Tax=Planococcus sp. A6 TaxID=2992760 RepID=UPI00237B40F3|nr:hypothetical protein [Planococcus sp. A6]MDE0582016.1 hypothetical protein [Planococcus sp. A6]
MEKQPETSSKQEEMADKEPGTSTKVDKKIKKRKRPPINPNYKPTTVNIDDLRTRLRAESRAALRRAGIWLD